MNDMSVFEHITITEEILNASNLKLNKPIYLYAYEDLGLCLSNKKIFPICYGTIKLDNTLSFDLPANAINAMDALVPDRDWWNKDISPINIMYVVGGTIVMQPSFSKFNPILSQRVCLTEEILAASTLRINKPIYIKYSSENKSFYLSNQINSNKCYGTIKLDNELSFDIPINAVKSALESFYNTNILFIVMVQNGIIYLNPYEINSEWLPKKTLCIPDEILDVCSLNFKKPVYLYRTNSGDTYLSNRKKLDRCLGTLTLDNENNFELTKNTCAFLNLTESKAQNMYLQVVNGDIFIVV